MHTTCSLRDGGPGAQHHCHTNNMVAMRQDGPHAPAEPTPGLTGEEAASGGRACKVTAGMEQRAMHVLLSPWGPHDSAWLRPPFVLGLRRPSEAAALGFEAGMSPGSPSGRMRRWMVGPPLRGKKTKSRHVAQWRCSKAASAGNRLVAPRPGYSWNHTPPRRRPQPHALRHLAHK